MNFNKMASTGKSSNKVKKSNKSTPNRSPRPNSRNRDHRAKRNGTDLIDTRLGRKFSHYEEYKSNEINDDNNEIVIDDAVAELEKYAKSRDKGKNIPISNSDIFDMPNAGGSKKNRVDISPAKQHGKTSSKDQKMPSNVSKENHFKSSPLNNEHPLLAKQGQSHLSAAKKDADRQGYHSKNQSNQSKRNVSPSPQPPIDVRLAKNNGQTSKPSDQMKDLNAQSTSSPTMKDVKQPKRNSVKEEELIISGSNTTTGSRGQRQPKFATNQSLLQTKINRSSGGDSEADRERHVRTSMGGPEAEVILEMESKSVTLDIDDLNQNNKIQFMGEGNEMHPRHCHQINQSDADISRDINERLNSEQPFHKDEPVYAYQEMKDGAQLSQLMDRKRSVLVGGQKRTSNQALIGEYADQSMEQEHTESGKSPQSRVANSIERSKEKNFPPKTRGRSHLMNDAQIKQINVIRQKERGDSGQHRAVDLFHQNTSSARAMKEMQKQTVVREVRQELSNREIMNLSKQSLLQKSPIKKKKKQKQKPYAKMNEHEKKERIKFLWRKVRILVKTSKFITQVQQNVEDEFILDMAQDVSYDFLASDQDKSTRGEKRLPWYLLDINTNCMIFWEMLVALLALWTYLSVPVLLVFPQLRTTTTWTIELGTQCFWLLELVLSFFKVHENIKQPVDLKKTATHYLRSYFIFDVCSTVPAIFLIAATDYITIGSVFTLGRFVHVTRLPMPLRMFIDKFVNASKTRRRDLVNISVVFGGALLLGHIFACVWIYLGRWDEGLPEEEHTSWVLVNDFPVVEGNESFIYFFSLYWILETMTTVGYGDYSGGNTREYIFSMILEFVGLSFFSLLMGVMSTFINHDTSFEFLIETRMHELDLWIRKVERSSKPDYLHPKLYGDITKYVKEAFLFDFNLIVEEFCFYQMLMPKDQKILINTLFEDFIERFDHFFGTCEVGFRNEFIIQMYARIYNPGETIQECGKKFREIFFIREGEVDLLNNKKKINFFKLPQNCIFGDYFVIFKLKSNIVFQASKNSWTSSKVKESLETVCMCLDKKKFMELCELYPDTYTNLKFRALERREIYLHYLNREVADSHREYALRESGVPRAIESADDPQDIPSMYKVNKRLGSPNHGSYKDKKTYSQQKTFNLFKQFEGAPLVATPESENTPQPIETNQVAPQCEMVSSPISLNLDPSRKDGFGFNSIASIQDHNSSRKGMVRSESIREVDEADIPEFLPEEEYIMPLDMKEEATDKMILEVTEIISRMEGALKRVNKGKVQKMNSNLMQYFQKKIQNVVGLSSPGLKPQDAGFKWGKDAIRTFESEGSSDSDDSGSSSSSESDSSNPTGRSKDLALATPDSFVFEDVNPSTNERQRETNEWANGAQPQNGHGRQPQNAYGLHPDLSSSPYPNSRPGVGNQMSPINVKEDRLTTLHEVRETGASGADYATQKRSSDYKFDSVKLQGAEKTFNLRTRKSQIVADHSQVKQTVSVSARPGEEMDDLAENELRISQNVRDQSAVYEKH